MNEEIKNKLINHTVALKHLSAGRTIAFICKHHTYKIVDGNIVCMNEKTEKEYPFDGFSKDEIEGNFIVIEE